MLLKKQGDSTIITDEKQERAFFQMKVGQNGKKYADRATVTSEYLHVSMGNSKTGEGVINFNFPIEYTCTHFCHCYLDGACYASGGCYSYASNQAGYSENLNFYLDSTVIQMVNAFQLVINATGCKLWRYFTCGDIPDSRFLLVMDMLAHDNPDVKFWTYTKKYALVNRYIDKVGKLSDNLTIIFSHWLNDDGTYFPMDNRHNMPTSEFIPLGKEQLVETVTHVCPCSNPDIVATCATCDHPCYDLKPGESMALLEHSTSRTKKRDRQVKEGKERAKKSVA